MIDCHIHMILDGIHMKNALAAHQAGVIQPLVRQRLEIYRDLGYTYLRDGGDNCGVGLFAAKIAQEYSITYRTPAFAIHKKGHYGSYVGLEYGDFSEYLELLQQVRRQGGTFVKLMIAGLMDFSHYGKCSEEPMAAQEIHDLVAAAHDLGFSVMVHANGLACDRAIAAGVESLEHGGYMSQDCLCQLAESQTVWVPTLAPYGNLVGKGLFSDQVLSGILENQMKNVNFAAKLGTKIGLGSDAGAGFVPHGQGGLDELAYLKTALGTQYQERLHCGNKILMAKF